MIIFSSTRSPQPSSEDIPLYVPLQRELSLILKELRIVTDKIRDDEEAAAVLADWR